MVQQAAGGVIFGSLGAVTLGTVLALGTYQILYYDSTPGESASIGEGIGEALMSYAIGYTTAYVLVGSYAITAIGNLNNPIKGKWVPTLVGNSVGLAVGIVGMATMIDSDIDHPVILISWVLGSATTGALIGYNSSRVDVRISSNPTRLVSLRIPLKSGTP